MCNQIKTSGKQMFMGVEIPIVEGGFGDGRKCVTDKTVSEIHEIKVIHVRELINKNINRFKEGIDYIDLKRIDQTDTLDLTTLGYAKQSITQAKSIYLLSERGYSKVIKIMDTDKAWEVHDHLMDEYFYHSGEEVLDMINRGFHADPSMSKPGYEPKSAIEGTPVWEFATEELDRTNLIMRTLKEHFDKNMR